MPSGPSFLAQSAPLVAERDISANQVGAYVLSSAEIA